MHKQYIPLGISRVSSVHKKYRRHSIDNTHTQFMFQLHVLFTLAKRLSLLEGDVSDASIKTLTCVAMILFVFWSFFYHWSSDQLLVSYNFSHWSNDILKNEFYKRMCFLSKVSLDSIYRKFFLRQILISQV